jgi:hypothetical protein
MELRNSGSEWGIKIASINTPAEISQSILFLILVFLFLSLS